MVDLVPNASMLKWTDLIIATMVLLGAGALLIFALSNIRELHGRTNLLERPIPLGVTNVAFLDGAKCVGSLKIDFSKTEGQMGLILSGSLRTSLQGRVTPISLKGDLAFNMIGQLGGGYIQFEIADQNIMIGLEEINPIQVTLIAPAFGLDSRRKLVIPGPVELSPSGSEAYHMRYAPLGSRETPMSLMLRQYSRELGVHPETSEEAFAACEMSTDALAIDAFSDRFRKHAEGLRKFLPDAAMGLSVPRAPL